MMESLIARLKEHIGTREIGLFATALLATFAASMGIVKSCQNEGLSDEFCGHMEMMMGDTAGAQYAGLREGTPTSTFLHLSPHLADTLDLLAEDAPKETRFLFEILHRNFDEGTKLLQRVMGYSDEKVEQFRVFEFNENTRIVDLVGSEVKPGALEAASDEIYNLLDATYFARKAGEVPRFRADGVRCGVFPEPDEDECSDLLDSAAIASIYGFPEEEFANTVSVAYDDGNCMWTLNYEASPENPEGNDAYLWVDVFSSTTANRVLTARLANPGDVTKEPVVVDGARTSIGVYPCGRTAFVDLDDRSAVVAACGPTDLSATVLIDIASQVIASR